MFVIKLVLDSLDTMTAIWRGAAPWPGQGRGERGGGWRDDDQWNCVFNGQHFTASHSQSRHTAAGNWIHSRRADSGGQWIPVKKEKCSVISADTANINMRDYTPALLQHTSHIRPVPTPQDMYNSMAFLNFDIDATLICKTFGKGAYYHLVGNAH